MPAPRTVGPNTKAIVVSATTDSQTIHTGPGRLWGLHVTTATSAHLCLFQDNATVIAAIPVSSAIGFNLQFNGGIPFTTSLVFNPDDAATTGVITVTYEEG